MKEVSVNKDVSRSFPPRLGDGREADLFKLFWVVRSIGGYEEVSESELWEIVAEECGLEVGVVASLKLIYVKYLKELDQWLSRAGFRDKKKENREIGLLEKLDLLSRELEGYKGPSCSGEEKAKVVHEVVAGLDEKGKCVSIELGDNEGVLHEKDDETTLQMVVVENESGMEMDTDIVLHIIGDNEKFSVKHEHEVVSPPKNVVNEVLSFGSDNIIPFSAEDDDENKATTSPDGNDSVISAKTVVEKVVSAEKRMRVDGSSALSEMVNWVANAARNPHDLAIGTLPHSSKWKEYGSDEIWKRVAKRDVNAEKEQLGLQRKKQRIHPSMYNDNKIPSPRGSQRVTSVKLCSCPGCISRTSSRSKHHKAEAPRTSVLELPESNELHDDVPEKSEKVAVIREGPGYQADVPEWTGVVSESDPKWLGTPVWPPPEDDGKQEMDLMVVGKGRESSCDCWFPGSAACDRFHVAEDRMKLKRALGSLYHRWGFNQMGEEVSLSWTSEEEKEFKNLVAKANQDLGKVTSMQEITSRFWQRASESLPTKTKAQLVNYYFNVFILRRRCYQNRVTPEDIDSDDDEKEMGSVGGSFGLEKIHVPTMICLENKQYTNLDVD